MIWTHLHTRSTFTNPEAWMDNLCTFEITISFLLFLASFLPFFLSFLPLLSFPSSFLLLRVPLILLFPSAFSFLPSFFPLLLPFSYLVSQRIQSNQMISRPHFPLKDQTCPDHHRRRGRKETEKSLALSHFDKNDSRAFIQTIDKNVEQD